MALMWALVMATAMGLVGFGAGEIRVRSRDAYIRGLWEENRRLMHRGAIDDGLADLMAAIPELWGTPVPLEEYDAYCLQTYCSESLGIAWEEEDGSTRICGLPIGHTGRTYPRSDPRR